MAGFSYETDQTKNQDDDEQFGLGLNPGTGTMPAGATGGNMAAPTDTSFLGGSQNFNEKGQTLDGTTPGGAPAGNMAAPAVTSATDATTFNQSNDLANLVRQMTQATDPREKSVLQDQAARGIFSTLKDQGHDVKWQGDQLIVDGRAYVLGDGSSTTKSGGSTADMPNADGSGGITGGVSGSPVQTVPYQGGDPWQYFVQLGQGMPATPQNLVAMEPQLAQAGIKVLRNAAGVAGKIQMPDGTIHDVIENAGLGGGGAWVDQTGDGGGDDAGLGSLDDLLAMFSGGAGATAAPDRPTFTATAPTYTPGATPDDLEGMGLGDMEGLFGVGDPVDLSGGANGTKSDDLLSHLLDNPDSISDLDIDKMKAKSKDELADMANTDDEAMRRFGLDTGIADSNWLASQRSDIRGKRDNALVQSNRQIESDAAATRKSDERAAIQLGQTAKDSTVSNLFKSKAEQQTAAQLASDTTLRAASLNNDRAALRESVKQKAAELGQSADQIQMQYTLGVMDDISKRYGIDVSRDIETMKNATNIRLAAEDLAFKYASLAQDDAQFGADYGLRLKQFEGDEDERAWRRQFDALKLGE